MGTLRDQKLLSLHKSISEAWYKHTKPVSSHWQTITQTCRPSCFSSTCDVSYQWKQQEKVNRKMYFSQWLLISCV